MKMPPIMAILKVGFVIMCMSLSQNAISARGDPGYSFTKGFGNSFADTAGNAVLTYTYLPNGATNQVTRTVIVTVAAGDSASTIRDNLNTKWNGLYGADITFGPETRGVALNAFDGVINTTGAGVKLGRSTGGRLLSPVVGTIATGGTAIKGLGGNGYIDPSSPLNGFGYFNALEVTSVLSTDLLTLSVSNSTFPTIDITTQQVFDTYVDTIDIILMAGMTSSDLENQIITQLTDIGYIANIVSDSTSIFNGYIEVSHSSGFFNSEIGISALVDTSSGSVTGIGFESAAVAIVPVPAAVWLFGSGLLGLVGMARRKA